MTMNFDPTNSRGSSNSSMQDLYDRGSLGEPNSNSLRPNTDDGMDSDEFHLPDIGGEQVDINALRLPPLPGFTPVMTATTVDDLLEQLAFGTTGFQRSDFRQKSTTELRNYTNSNAGGTSTSNTPLDLTTQNWFGPPETGFNQNSTISNLSNPTDNSDRSDKNQPGLEQNAPLSHLGLPPGLAGIRNRLERPQTGLNWSLGDLKHPPIGLEAINPDVTTRNAMLKDTNRNLFPTPSGANLLAPTFASGGQRPPLPKPPYPPGLTRPGKSRLTIQRSQDGAAAPSASSEPLKKVKPEKSNKPMPNLGLPKEERKLMSVFDPNGASEPMTSEPTPEVASVRSAVPVPLGYTPRPSQLDDPGFFDPYALPKPLNFKDEHFADDSDPVQEQSQNPATSGQVRNRRKISQRWLHSDFEEKHRPSTINNSTKAIFQSGNGQTHIHDSIIVVGATSSATTSSATGVGSKQELEGFVQITSDIFMNTHNPIKEGVKVYEGYQKHVTGQRQPLAIKAIVPCTKKSIREVQHLVTLTPHPNVVRIIRSTKHKAHLLTLYIAMELCGSKNLHDYLNANREKNKTFDFKKTMSYSKGLIKGMKHIHCNRIIHGDLKPENILFSLDGDQIKISDFGISKELRQSRSSTKRTSQGTDGYRAPETYNSDIISMKADIFSLGVTLYCLWTNGKHPFGANPHRWVVNIIDNTGRDLSGLPEEMGNKKDEFLDILDKMLQVNPRNRPTIKEISKHPFLSRSRATAQASSTRQLSLGTSPVEAFSELPFVTPTTSESPLAFEETRPKEGREVIMQMSDLDLSPRLENSPDEAIHRVFGSAQTRQKKDPGHLHRMASSSGPWDHDHWRKKLRVTNIPRHLSSYKALKHHFERFGQLEKFFRRNRWSSACITFCNHRDALAARYGAVSAGPDHNLVIKWDDIEDPAVNAVDSYPSSRIQNAIFDWIYPGLEKAMRSETLRKMKNLSMDVDKLNVWRVIVKSSRAPPATFVIHNMDRGCRICSSDPSTETRFLSEKVKINGEERLIYELDKIEIPSGRFSFIIEPGIVVWFDHETLQLFANQPTDCASFDATFGIMYNRDPDFHFSPLSKVMSVPIFSIKKFVDWIERKERDGGRVTGGEGVEIHSRGDRPFFLPTYKIQIIPEGILQFQ